MTAPVVSPGGASPPRAIDARGARRREEAAQTDGSFAALLAALAPAVPSLADGAVPEAGVPGAPAPEGGPLGILSMLTGLPQGGPAVQTDGGLQAGNLPFPADLAVPGQDGSAPAPADPQNPLWPAAPTGESAAVVPRVPAGTPEVPGPVGTAGQDGTVIQPVPVRIDLADRPEDAAQPDEPTLQAPGAAAVQAPSAEAPPQPAAERAGRSGAGLGEGGTDQQPAFRAASAEGQDAADSAATAGAAPGQAADAAAGPADGPAPAAEASPASGLERLTAGRLQAQQVMEELTRALPELQDGQYRLTLRLHPEHLGEVRLELHLVGREVHAAMEVTNVDARQALESRGDQLRQNLSDAGYNLAGFEVATGQGRQPRREQEEGPADWPEPPVRSARPVEGPSSAAVQRIRSPGARGGRLDTMA